LYQQFLVILALSRPALTVIHINKETNLKSQAKARRIRNTHMDTPTINNAHQALVEIDPKWSGKTGYLNCIALFQKAVAAKGKVPAFIDGRATIEICRITTPDCIDESTATRVVATVSVDEWAILAKFAR
jgi:hypothetical protein